MGAMSSTGYHSSDSMSSIQTSSESSAAILGSSNLSSDLTQNLGVQLGIGKEKKRKAAPLVLSTLRKRFIRKCRTSKSFDHSQVFREFLEEWSQRDIALLVEHYEAQIVLRELALQADLARPATRSCQQDLGIIYESKFSPDIELIYKGRCFPAHRAILCVRCPFFQEMLYDPLSCGSQVAIEIDIPGVSFGMFNELLKYLYTGELSVNEKYEGYVDTLIQLSEQFGIPNPLKEDMKYLMSSRLFTDACLVFQNSIIASCSLTAKVGLSPDVQVHELENEIPCHKVVLAARSPFFRNVIQRYQKRSTEVKEPAVMQIVLDDGVVPRRYAKVLLFALYCDTFDLLSLLTETEKHNNTTSSEGSSSSLARSYQQSLVNQLVELYEVAQLLEMDSLVYGCEDLLIENLSQENLSHILQWSEQPHGSQWVHRQAMNYLREEFSTLVASGMFVHLEKHHLKEAISSDFLQASELEVLQAVFRWGEAQLCKQGGEREPVVATPQPVYMVGRKGPRRRDFCFAELRDTISDLICFVRVHHILPPESDLLANAVKRGLFPSPPSCMLDDDHVQGSGVYHKIASWVHGRKGGPASLPRLFFPYVEEARAWLDEHSARELEPWTSSHNAECQPTGDRLSVYQNRSSAFHTTDSAEGIEFLDGNVPVPSDATLRLMRKREQELRHSQTARQAFSYKQVRYEATKLIQLQVVREFGLPDSVVEVLHRPMYLFVEELNDGDHRLATCSVHQEPGRTDGNFSSFVGDYGSHEVQWGYQASGGDVTSYLRSNIPDIAIATTALGKIHIATDKNPDVQS
ncbi:LOW QUALITY PROTEIN: BTB/POZ domain-containing protein 7-like [Tachypleus tridentatus]|uniref:LOW QUALITY PROTEIN: BTB/POZ domain-containing protein 7-like n=1 Tax=Tachypleus tridentatus TaxID=6853 RepID=UPI003FD271DB